MEVDNKKNDQNIIPNDADKPQKGVNVPNLRLKNIMKIGLLNHWEQFVSF